MRKPSPKTLRRLVLGAAIVLSVSGIGMVAYPFATDMWAARIQGGLDVAASVDSYRAGKIAVGDPVTRLEIPKLGVNVVVVEGTSLAALRAGAGHYPETPLPGEPGNVAIAGHRTTYGKPFNRIDELRKGDKVILTTPLGRHTYRVVGAPWVVDPLDWSPINDYGKSGSFLTLTSCHPEGSAAQRIVVRAKLVDSEPVTLAARSAS